MTRQRTLAHAILNWGSVASLLAMPVTLGVVFLLHFASFGEFMDFTLARPPYDALRLYQTLTSGDGGWRYFMLPHYVGYITLPLFIAAALVVARAIFADQPLIAVVGAGLTVVGTVFMGGVFGSWLAFVPASTLGQEAGPAALSALTVMRGALLVSTILSALSLAGMVILGVGMMLARRWPLWSGAAFTLGNLIIIVFMDRDNWMFLGTVVMFAGVVPLALELWRSSDVTRPGSSSEPHPAS
jgi:hypothetical protein